MQQVLMVRAYLQENIENIIIFLNYETIDLVKMKIHVLNYSHDFMVLQVQVFDYCY